MTGALLRGTEPSVTTSNMLLAIDTSAERAGIALWDGAALHETQWPADRRQTTEVMPRIEALLSGARSSVSGLCGVAVAQGPGTFTGLRVGMSLAKGFAIALGIPIFGIPTLQATALPWTLAGRTVVAVLPAGRGRLVWQRISPDDDFGHPVNGIPEELLTVLRDTEVDAVVGELPAYLREALAHAPVPVLGEPGLVSRVGAVALLGRQRLMSGQMDDLVTLEPIYVHGTPKAADRVQEASP